MVAMKIIKPDMQMATLSDSAIFKSMDMKYIPDWKVCKLRN
jgi:hypothetical protein